MQDHFRAFAKNLLHERDCRRYIANETKGEKDANGHISCFCGRGYAWHKDNNCEGVCLEEDSDTATEIVELELESGQGKPTWSPDLHTSKRPTTAYGTIEFAGFGNRTQKSPVSRQKSVGFIFRSVPLINQIVSLRPFSSSAWSTTPTSTRFTTFWRTCGACRRPSWCCLSRAGRRVSS